MGDKTFSVEVTLTVEETDHIKQLFIGYEDIDGTEFILAKAEPPAIAELKGNRPQSGESRN